jgi:hypothetical protein
VHTVVAKVGVIGTHFSWGVPVGLITAEVRKARSFREPVGNVHAETVNASV